MTLKAAAQQALEVLEALVSADPTEEAFDYADNAITALRQALEQANEPHSWYSAKHDEWMTEKTRREHETLNSYTHKVGNFDLPLYTHPQPAAPISDVTEAVTETVIKVEKLLCEKLGKQWAASGMSIQTLVDEFASRTQPAAHGLDWWALFDENQRLRADLKFNSPQREWVGLTDEEAINIGEQCQWYDGDCERFDSVQFARSIEAKLKEKNYGTR
jgi:hypothetical protein